MNIPTKKEVKKWCNALRSGKYKQTKFQLQDRNGYCCLGVACDIFIPAKKKKINGYYLKGLTPSEQPDSPIWLDEINNEFFKLTDTKLSAMNDTRDYSFDEIADCLELVYIHKALN